MNAVLNKLEAEQNEVRVKLQTLRNSNYEDFTEEIQLRQQLKDVQKHIRWLKKEINNG